MGDFYVSVNRMEDAEKQLVKGLEKLPKSVPLHLHLGDFYLKWGKKEKALEAYKNMLQRADGAMTSTRLPHLEAVEGVIAVSHRNGPAPVLSPLRDDYVSQLQSLATGTRALSLHPFNSVAQACQILEDLAKATIYPFRKG